jgi:hypothetical protein
MTDSILQALIAKYDLRDGHVPDEPFIAADNWSDLPLGWFPLAEQLIQDLIRLGWDRRVLQIKEKYGTLRLYISQREDLFRDRINAAMEQSGTVCQDCGGAGTWHDEGSMSALCDLCRARRKAERGER